MEVSRGCGFALIEFPAVFPATTTKCFGHQKVFPNRYPNANTVDAYWVGTAECGGWSAMIGFFFCYFDVVAVREMRIFMFFITRGTCTSPHVDFFFIF